MKKVIWVLALGAVLYRGYMLLDNVSKSNPHNVVWVALFIVSTTVLLLVIGALIEDIQQERKRKKK